VRTRKPGCAPEIRLRPFGSLAESVGDDLEVAAFLDKQTLKQIRHF
jgi:hypothetical protein